MTMKKNEKKDKLFLIIIFLLCLLLFCKRLTGEACHAILGLLLVSMAVVHVCIHIRKLKYKKLSVRMMDSLLFIALAVVLVSGILLHPLQGAFFILILHKISSVVLVLGMIVHVLQHKKEK